MSWIDGEPQTWEEVLREHWEIFCKHTWYGFSVFEEETRRIGHENKVTKMQWREYLIWDMQRRHEEEKNGLGKCE